MEEALIDWISEAVIHCECGAKQVVSTRFQNGNM